ncbi:glycerophosphodiester phosphodiesterase family protein [Corynebacterium sp. Q4381]|uniref:glycerophosphodiester phosphodiesterase family protein n=1 Tax=Corynebacterium sp. Marseille-Q4381 TaxID=3121597 RepID=UPI002FE57136
MTQEVLGRQEYAAVNRRFLAACNVKRPLIAVHRGQNAGSIVENTARAVRAAIVSGADIVEIDVIESTDGDFFTFHNGFEGVYFGLDRDIRTLSTKELERLQFDLYVSAKAEKYGLERLETIVCGFPDTLLNIDRSWEYWDHLLPFLDDLGCVDRVLFKSPVAQEWLQKLADHPVKYPYMPIVKSKDEVELVLNCADVNTIAVEILAASEDEELASQEFVQEMHDLNLLVQTNALNLPNRVPLFLGWDDEISVLDEPEKGWGRLVDHGADIIQTDWPMLLDRFLSTRG